MVEFLKECFVTVNFPASILLVLVLAYWLMVIVGVLGMDVFDFDLDIDADVDLDGDIDIEGHGILGSFLEFLYLGEIPVAIIGSFFVFFMWVVTVTSNHYLNEQQSFLVMMLWLIPNVFLSLMATKVTLMPMATLFKNYDKSGFTRDRLIGAMGMVKTSEVTSEFGQLEVQQQGPPLVLNVRTQPGTTLRKGDAAKIIAFNDENDTFLIELSKWEKS